MMPSKKNSAVAYYTEARDWVLASPYYGEIIWQASANYDNFSESQLLCEHAWVVLNSGFREEVIRKRFGYISLCFCDWESAETIASAGEVCVTTAMGVFRNERKLNAILNAARQLSVCGFDEFANWMRADPVAALTTLPYIGPITALHLAKNLGLDVMKPDRHLVRLATQLGYDDASVMCQALAQETGDSQSIIDLVLWRFQQQISAGLGSQQHDASHPPSSAP